MVKYQILTGSKVGLCAVVIVTFSCGDGCWKGFQMVGRFRRQLGETTSRIAAHRPAEFFPLGGTHVNFTLELPVRLLLMIFYIFLSPEGVNSKCREKLKFR